MSTPVIPAWKKLGLKVKEDIRKDPLTGQVQATPASNKPATSDNNNNKRSADSIEDSEKTKKPPKRVKVPKAERKAPPESDNLVYLRQYHTDRANWKFSKQKQNWILKNIYEIQADYVDHLMAYLKGLQGGARERVTQESFEIITHWNEYMKAPAEPEEGEAEAEAEAEAKDEEKKEDTTTDETKDNNDEKTTKKAKKEDAPPPPPTEPKARRAQTIFNALTGNLVPLELLEEEVTAVPDATPTAAENETPVAEKEVLQSEEPEKKTEEKKDKKEKKSKKEKKDKSSKKSHK